LIVWLYWAKQNYTLAGYTLILSGATDILDGYIARHFHMTSNLGKILDPVADKLTQAAMLICLMPYFPWIIIPIGLMAVKEIFMSVTGVLIMRRSGIVLGASWHGKAATCLLYGMILLHVFCNDIPTSLSITSAVACTLMIAVSFILYGIRNIQVLVDSDPCNRDR